LIENIYSLPWAKDCHVLENNPNGLLVVEKAVGVLAHPNLKNSFSKIQNQPSLLSLAYDHKKECYLTPNGSILYLLHRLDSPTSGLIMFSSNKTLAAKLKNLFRQNLVNKTYHAVVSQKQNLQLGSWVDSLVEKKVMGKMRVSRGNGVIAKTQCYLDKTIGGPNRFALLKLVPKTGRTHQLRVQAASRKMPILGDKTYGDYIINREVKKQTKISRLFLHASMIEFKLDSKSYKYMSSLPAAFKKLDRFVLKQKIG